MCSTSFSFSAQMNSMSSASTRSSTISFWFTRTLNGAVAGAAATLAEAGLVKGGREGTGIDAIEWARCLNKVKRRRFD